jgi:translation initiation factor 1
MERRLVYDSDAVSAGRCPTCGKRLDRCSCGSARLPKRSDPDVPNALLNLPNDGFVRLLRDRKGRGGKGVTLVAGVPGSADVLTKLTSELKRLCGTGGTVRGEVIELQGDVRERVKVELERRGYRVKIAGG